VRLIFEISSQNKAEVKLAGKYQQLNEIDMADTRYIIQAIGFQKLTTDLQIQSIIYRDNLAIFILLENKSASLWLMNFVPPNKLQMKEVVVGSEM